MILAVISLFIPVVGICLIILIAALAAFAVGSEFTFGIVAIGINLSNIFLS